MCYHQNLTESEVGRDQDGLKEIYMEELRESACYAEFGLVCPCICNILGYVSIS